MGIDRQGLGFLTEGFVLPAVPVNDERHPEMNSFTPPSGVKGPLLSFRGVRFAERGLSSHVLSQAIVGNTPGERLLAERADWVQEWGYWPEG
jgi:hypothetical protein